MKIKLLIPLLLIYSFSISQRLQINVGPMIDMKQFRSEMDIPKFKIVMFKPVRYGTALFFNRQSKRAYSGVGFDGKSFQFATFENYVKYSGAKKLTSELLNGKVNLNAFITVNDRMFVFYTTVDEKNDSFTLYVNEVSGDMVIMGSPIILHKYSDLKGLGKSIGFATSRDEKYLLISRIYDGKAKDPQRLSCKVIDGSFSEKWFKEFTLDGTDKEIAIQNYDIDNNGNLYFLVERREKRESQPMLYSYYWQSKSLKSFKVGPESGDNFGTNMELLGGLKPYVVGLNEVDKKVTYFAATVNTQTQTVEKLGSNSLPDDFYKSSQRGIFDMKDWGVRNIVSLDNNHIVASIEALIVITRNGIPVSYDTYNTYLISFQENGKPNWTHTVKKLQTTLQQMAGHLLIPAKNNVLVVYNDHPENLSKKVDEKKIETFVGLKESMVTVQEIDPTGKVSKYAFSKDPGLFNFALNINDAMRIETGLFYAPAIHMKSRFSIESRVLTFKVL